jgi:hypothetical protein
MNGYHEPDPIHLASIETARKILFTKFGIDFTNVTRESHGDYVASGAYSVDIYALNHTDLYIGFKTLIHLENGLLVSKLNDPMINDFVKDMNSFFYIFDALRFTTWDQDVFYPILDNIRPSIIFKYNIECDDMMIHIDLHPTIESEESIYITTKDIIIQHGYEPAGFKAIYHLNGSHYLSDLLTYKTRLLKVWNIDENSRDIDYKRLGVLTDMITI